MARDRLWQYGAFSLDWPGTGTGTQVLNLGTHNAGETVGHMFIRATWNVTTAQDNSQSEFPFGWYIAPGLDSTFFPEPPQGGQKTFLFGRGQLSTNRAGDGESSATFGGRIGVKDEGHGQLTFDGTFEDSLFLVAAVPIHGSANIAFHGLVKYLLFFN